MRKGLVNFLSDYAVEFGKVTDEKVGDLCLYGRANTIYEKVYGNSKEEILEKMILIKKEHSKILKLPLKEDFIKKFKNKELLIKESKLYRFKTSRFIDDLPTDVCEEYGRDILKELYFIEHFYVDFSGGEYDQTTERTSYKFFRRDNDVDWSIWGRHKKLVSTYESNITKI